jgi:hypothetical protein
VLQRRAVRPNFVAEYFTALVLGRDFAAEHGPEVANALHDVNQALGVPLDEGRSARRTSATYAPTVRSRNHTGLSVSRSGLLKV